MSRQMKRFVEKLITIPKGFECKPSDPGTTAYLYLSGERDPANLTDDDDLMWVIDDKHPQGGLLYIFKDHSSVVYKPKTH